MHKKMKKIVTLNWKHGAPKIPQKLKHKKYRVI